MSLIDWIFDKLASEDVIDAYFIMSEMVDIDLTDEEIAETAHMDATCSHVQGNHRGDDSGIPLGKRVW